jgi:hypothetical protein
MGFLSEFLKGLKAAREPESGGGQLVPMDGPSARQMMPRNSALPTIRETRRPPAERDKTEYAEPLIEYEVPEDMVAPGAPLVRFELWCSRTGRPFLAVAERHGDTLYLVGNEKADGEVAGSGWPGGYNYFAIDAAPEWRCPWCGVREDPSHEFLRLIWECGESACGAPLHCCGSSRGIFLCACGMRSRRGFCRGDVFKVYEYTGLRGASGRGLGGTQIRDGTVVTSQYLSKSAGTLLKRRSTWLPVRGR